MNPGWRIIDCLNFEGEIHYRRGQLLLKSVETGQEHLLPLAQLGVILIGTKASVSGATLMQMAKYDVAFIVCNWKGVPVSALYPFTDHSRICARQRAQAMLSKPREKQAWKRIISSKIRGQAANLEGASSREILELARQVRSGDLDNLEAVAARKYWRLFSEGFARRPGVSDSALNAALDYGYTIVRGCGMRAVASAGLSGALGVFHHSRSNMFALVDDLMEPFRPMVDYWARELANGGELTSDIKQSLVEKITTASFNEDGCTLPTVFTDFAQQYGQYVESQVSQLQVPRWNGTHDAEEG